MFFGCPSVSTAVGGIPEVIADRVSGILVPFGDLDGLARGVESLLHTLSRRTMMGQAAQQRAHKDFTADTIVQQYEALYWRVCTSRFSQHS